MFDKKEYKSLNIEILYLKAQHDMNAQLYLALAYYHGNGVKKDIDKAHYWLERAGHTVGEIEKTNGMKDR